MNRRQFLVGASAAAAVVTAPALPIQQPRVIEVAGFTTREQAERLMRREIRTLEFSTHLRKVIGRQRVFFDDVEFAITRVDTDGTAARVTAREIMPPKFYEWATTEATPDIDGGNR